MAAALLVAYLAFDGLTSTYQEHLFRTHATLTAATLVAYVSAVASVMALAAALSSGQLPAAVRFAVAHPEVGFYVVALSAAAAGASLLINDTIRRFGALAFAGIMTSRQLISVLASAVAFRHPLSAAQWAGAALVFVSLYGRLLLETRAAAGAKTMRGALPTEDEPAALDESPASGAHTPSAV
jgi:adenosine 3'-phospho 5'-phosphosulfate transporter B2